MFNIYQWIIRYIFTTKSSMQTAKEYMYRRPNYTKYTEHRNRIIDET